MRISISARIFGGFLLVLLAFTGVMGYTLHRVHRVRQDLRLVNQGYLRLVLLTSDLHISQGHLLNTTEERTAGQRTSRFLRTQVRLALLYRQRKVELARRVVQRSRKLASGPRHQFFLDRIDLSLTQLQLAYRRSAPLFVRLFAEEAPPPLKMREKVGEPLVGQERKVAAQIKHLFDELRDRVRRAALQVEQEENRAIWAMLVMVVVAVLVSMAVTFGAQLTLRPLKTLVAGTRRIGRGDYAHRVRVRSRDELGVLATEFNNMAAAVQEREQRLIRSERMATAGRMASHVTHEIRNPLSSISLNTELLEEDVGALGLGEGDVEETLSLCRAIRKEVDRLTDFTEEYLRFARLPQPNLQAEDIKILLLDLLSFTSGELRDKGVEVVHRLDEGLPPVMADESQLRRAFLNLVRNAGEAMAATGEGGTLEVVARLLRGQVEVRVKDNGPGIAPEDRAKVFEPFFSTKETGTGLGLALTQQIIQEHGGTIELESEPGAGTTFVVRLPVGGPERPA